MIRFLLTFLFFPALHWGIKHIPYCARNKNRLYRALGLQPLEKK